MGISFSTVTLVKPFEALSHTFLVMRIFFFRSVLEYVMYVCQVRRRHEGTNQEPPPKKQARHKSHTHPQLDAPPWYKSSSVTLKLYSTGSAFRSGCCWGGPPIPWYIPGIPWCIPPIGKPPR